MSDLLHELAVASDVYDLVSGNPRGDDDRERRWSSPVMFYLVGTAVVAGLIFLGLTLLANRGKHADRAEQQEQSEAAPAKKNPWAKD